MANPPRHRLILGTNIRKLRKARKLTILELATRVDSDVGNISRLERGMQGCSDDLLLRIATALSTTPSDLLRDESFENAVPVSMGNRRIPVINSIQAGQLTTVTDHFPPGAVHEWIETDITVSPETFALVLAGKSMYPDFDEGDKVIIDPQIRPQPGDFVAASANGDKEATFKKYRLRGITESGADIFELVPLNPDFPTIRSDETELRIIGVMVEHRRYRRRR